MLLVLSGGRLPRHLHLHRARQKQLLLLLVLKRVDTVGGHTGLCGCTRSSRSHHIVLEGLGRHSCSRGRLVVGHTSRLPLRLLVVMLVELVDV